MLDQTAQKLATPQGKARGYRMTHTFKRNEKGLIISAETIVTLSDEI